MSHNKYNNTNDSSSNTRIMIGVTDIGLTPCSNGTIVVEDNIIGLEGKSPARLSFYSSPAQLWFETRLHGKQILVSDVCYSILQPLFKNTAFLPCKFMHPVETGNITFELLPSGADIGSSFLLLRKHKSSLLYVSHFNININPLFRQSVFRHVNKILFSPQATPYIGAPPKQRLEQLKKMLLDTISSNNSPFIFLNPCSDLLAVLQTINANTPVFCDFKIKQFLNNITLYGESLETELLSKIKNILPITSFAQSPAIYLFADVPQKNLTKKLSKPVGSLFCSKTTPEGMSQIFESFFGIANYFDISFLPNVNDFLYLMQETKAKDVFLQGDNQVVAAWMHSLAQHGITAKALAVPYTTDMFS